MSWSVNKMSELLLAMQDYAANHNLPVIDPEGSALLAATVTACSPEAVLEIGTAIGYSTLLIAERLLPGARVTTIEIDSDRAAVAVDFINRSGFANRIEILAGDANEVLPSLHGTFDLIFIDAAKGQYLNYLRLIMDKLSPGAVIFADNVLYRGWVRGPNPPRRLKTMIERLREYVAFVTTDPRFVTTVYPIGDGVAISKYQEEPLLEKN